jgi:endonuclease YncB( thermonuclease family)
MSDEQQQPEETSAGTEPEGTTGEVGETNTDGEPDADMALHQDENAASQEPFVFAVGTNFDTTAAEWIGGDVIGCRAPGGNVVRMKLYGVAAPRDGQPYFKKARARLVFLTQNKPLHIRVRKILADGRLAVDVKVPPDKTEQAVNLPPSRINNQLVRRGYAWHDKAEAPDDIALKDFHAAAERERYGLWGEDEPPVAPWAWQAK